MRIFSLLALLVQKCKYSHLRSCAVNIHLSSKFYAQIKLGPFAGAVAPTGKVDLVLCSDYVYREGEAYLAGRYAAN